MSSSRTSTTSRLNLHGVSLSAVDIRIPPPATNAIDFTIGIMIKAVPNPAAAPIVACISGDCVCKLRKLSFIVSIKYIRNPINLQSLSAISVHFEFLAHTYELNRYFNRNAMQFYGSLSSSFIPYLQMIVHQIVVTFTKFFKLEINDNVFSFNFRYSRHQWLTYNYSRSRKSSFFGIELL